MKIPVITSDDYIVYIEKFNDDLFIHMDVYKWTKEVKSSFVLDWNKWAKSQNKDLFAMPFIDNVKMIKWSKICGFELFKNYECTDGVVRKLYIWRRKHG